MPRLDKGTDYRQFSHELDPKPKRTLFNLSYLHTFNADFAELIPFYLQETIPNDTFTMSNDILVRVQPMLVPLMSRIRIYTHYYYCRNSDLWSKWNYFITKGRSGNYKTPAPKFPMKNSSYKNIKMLDPDNQKWYAGFAADSIANKIGIPIVQYYTKTEGGETSYIDHPETGDNGKNKIVNEHQIGIDFNVLPFFMYQKIYRDFYMNKNLNQNDKIWFPDDERDFMLGEGEQKIEEKTPGSHAAQNEYMFLPTAQSATEIIDGSEGTVKGDYCLLTKRYRNWRDDYFTTAMPWPQRGTPPELELEKNVNISIPKQYIYASGYVEGGNNSHVGEKAVFAQPEWHNDTGNSDFWESRLISFRNHNNPIETFDEYIGKPGGAMATSWTKGEEAGFAATGSQGDLYPDWTNDVTKNGGWTAEALHTKAFTASAPISFAITMEKLRHLSIMQLWQERNGRTDGDYNMMIKAHFGKNPHQPDNSPIYIGGTVQDIVITEILQTSESTETGKLGEGGGHGISAGAGYVGSFHSPDYGFIMGIMSIMPDVTYTEGIDRELTRETFADYYYPEFNGLGPQAILNKELKIAGTNDDDLWGYQERFQEMKHRRNKVSGEMANEHDMYFKQWTMARFFGDQRPPLSQKFVSGKDTVRHEMFTMYKENPFTIQVANITRAVRPIPRKSIPKGLI